MRISLPDQQFLALDQLGEDVEEPGDHVVGDADFAFEGQPLGLNGSRAFDVVAVSTKLLGFLGQPCRAGRLGRTSVDAKGQACTNS